MQAIDNDEDVQVESSCYVFMFAISESNSIALT